MARAAGKKQTKPLTKSPLSQITSVSASTSSSIPEPFVVVPAQLRPFTSTLPTDHVYTVHVDNNAVTLKKRVYTVPILLNLVITAVLVVRIFYAVPVYVEQMITIFGYETSWKVHPASMAYGDIIATLINRTMLLSMDYVIFAFLGSWPWEFVFGSKYSRHTGPLDWRRQVGFRDTEIVVRKGRKWDDKLFKEEDAPWSREDELTIQVKGEAALRKSYTSKTGYLLLDKDWDLDFKGMIDAHKLVSKERIDLKDLDHILLVHHQKQWLLWRVHEGKDFVPANPVEDAAIQKFREKLTALGHEDIFFRWIEIIQYETSLPAGFTEEKQKEALGELRQLLVDRKVDYTKFLQEIGGQSGVPGLSQAS